MEFGISQDGINAVTLNERHMCKVSARCVPKLFGPHLKLGSICQWKNLKRIPTVFRNL